MIKNIVFDMGKVLVGYDGLISSRCIRLCLYLPNGFSWIWA